MHLTSELIDLHTLHAFNIAREAAAPVRRSVWIRVRDDEGLEGWGEAAANAFYGETAETVQAIIPRLAAALEESAEGDPFALEYIESALAHSIAGNPSARAAVSAALHDLVGKRLGVPVWKMWGLDPSAAPVSSFTIGIDDLPAMREKVREAASYPILKIKVGSPRDEEVPVSYTHLTLPTIYSV